MWSRIQSPTSVQKVSWHGWQHVTCWWRLVPNGGSEVSKHINNVRKGSSTVIKENSFSVEKDWVCFSGDPTIVPTRRFWRGLLVQRVLLYYLFEQTQVDMMCRTGYDSEFVRRWDGPDVTLHRGNGDDDGRSRGNVWYGWGRSVLVLSGDIF